MSEPRLAPEFHPVADAMFARIQSAQRVLVATHVNVDGDSLASVIALQRALTGLGKEAVALITDGQVAHSLRSLLWPAGPVRYTGQPLPPTDLTILPDITGLGRLGAAREQLADRLDSAATLVIDHHVSNERFGALNLVDTTAAATAEVIYLLLRRWGVAVTADIAEALLAGVLTDTLSFQTSSTTQRTFRVAADLVEVGAPLEALVTALFRAKPFSTAKLFGAVVGAARLEDGLLWTVVTPAMLAESGARASETEGIISYLAGVEEAVVLALLYEQPDGWRASLRSRSPLIDVSRLAAGYGGGGHPRAAGCTIPGGVTERDRFLTAVKAVIAPVLAATPAMDAAE